MLLLLLAALSPQTTVDLVCVAQLGIVADSQARGVGYRDVAPVKARGANYAAIVGARAMDEGALTREAVRDVIVGEFVKQRARGILPRGEIEFCLARMADLPSE